MSREWPTEALSSLAFSFSGASPCFLRSALSRQSVALFTVDRRAPPGWAAAPRQAAAAGAAPIATAAVASSPITTPRITLRRVERGPLGRAGRTGLEPELQVLAEEELPEASGEAPHLVRGDLQTHIGPQGVSAGSQCPAVHERVVGALAVGAARRPVEPEVDDRHARDAVDQQPARFCFIFTPKRCTKLPMRTQPKRVMSPGAEMQMFGCCGAQLPGGWVTELGWPLDGGAGGPATPRGEKVV